MMIQVSPREKPMKMQMTLGRMHLDTNTPRFLGAVPWRKQQEPICYNNGEAKGIMSTLFARMKVCTKKRIDCPAWDWSCLDWWWLARPLYYSTQNNTFLSVRFVYWRRREETGPDKRNLRFAASLGLASQGPGVFKGQKKEFWRLN